MTPDEVVGVLKVFREGWVPFTKGAKYSVEHQALTSAISLIQDYQKLRERVSVEKINLEKFIELGADLEHNRWAAWQKYAHSLCIKNTDGSLTIPKERVGWWEKQIATSYSDLPEKEKEYDRVEVRKYIPIIVQAIVTYLGGGKE